MRQHRGSNASIAVNVLYLMFCSLQIVLCIIYQCNNSVTIESYDSTTLRRWELSTAPSDYIFQYNFRLAWYKLQEGNFCMAVPLS